MIRRLMALLGATLAVFALAAPVVAEPEALDAGRCWPACEACVGRCRGDRRCELDCYDMGATCCEANGRRPQFRACGCR